MVLTLDGNSEYIAHVWRSLTIQYKYHEILEIRFWPSRANLGLPWSLLTLDFTKECRALYRKGSFMPLYTLLYYFLALWYIGHPALQKPFIIIIMKTVWEIQVNLFIYFLLINCRHFFFCSFIFICCTLFLYVFGFRSLSLFLLSFSLSEHKCNQSVSLFFSEYFYIGLCLSISLSLGMPKPFNLFICLSLCLSLFRPFFFSAFLSFSVFMSFCLVVVSSYTKSYIVLSLKKKDCMSFGLLLFLRNSLSICVYLCPFFLSLFDVCLFVFFFS